ncbi:unnamed protein product [Leptosia nina]|uniref:FLYWCH-type domain-containing protein n=1 Tax=Leptosia nina TaxID=320188 RepID=A0AAV1J6M4_9NEOP
MITLAGNKKNLMLRKGYTFSLHYSREPYQRWRCTTGNCKARMRMTTRGQLLKTFDTHNHPPPHYVKLSNGMNFLVDKARRLKGCRAAAVSFDNQIVAMKPHDHIPPKLPSNFIETDTLVNPHINQSF